MAEQAIEKGDTAMLWLHLRDCRAHKPRQLKLLLAQQNKGAKSAQALSDGHISVPLEPHNSSGT